MRLRQGFFGSKPSKDVDQPSCNRYDAREREWQSMSPSKTLSSSLPAASALVCAYVLQSHTENRVWPVRLHR